MSIYFADRDMPKVHLGIYLYKYKFIYILVLEQNIYTKKDIICTCINLCNLYLEIKFTVFCNVKDTKPKMIEHHFGNTIDQKNLLYIYNKKSNHIHAYICIGILQTLITTYCVQ